MFGCLPIRILLGPSGSEESSDQQESNSQVAVEGGNGGTAGVGANNAGTVSGGSGAAVENSSDVHITTSDPEVIEEALGVVGNVANDAIVGSQLTTGEALEDLQTEEEDTASVSQTAVSGGLNTATSSLQYRAGQQIDQAVSTSPLANISTSTLIAGVGVLLAVVYYISRKN